MRLLRIRRIEGRCQSDRQFLLCGPLRPSAVSAFRDAPYNAEIAEERRGPLRRTLTRRPLSGFRLAFVGSHPLGKGVAMDAEHGGSVGDVLLVAGERFLDVELFEFAERFIQKDVTFEHFVDQTFEASMNQSSFPVSSL